MLNAESIARGQKVRAANRASVRDRVAKECTEREALRLGQTRTAVELRNAQLVLAGVVYEHPELRDDEREAVLADVLQMCGIHRRIAGYTPKRTPTTCDGDTGTLRGYRRHLWAYDTPCRPCVRARHRELDERWADLGIEANQVVLPT